MNSEFHDRPRLRYSSSGCKPLASHNLKLSVELWKRNGRGSGLGRRRTSEGSGAAQGSHGQESTSKLPEKSKNPRNAARHGRGLTAPGDFNFQVNAG
jgi:hypothetical protein